MHKIYVILLLSLFTPKTQVIRPKQVDRVLDTSVLIRIKGEYKDAYGETKTGTAGCSGTFISEDEVLTAGHCFDMKVKNIWVRDINKGSYPAILEKLDKEHDLALLQVADLDEDHDFAKISKHVRVGEQVISVGTPFALEFLVSEGVVAKLDQKSKPFKSTYIVHTGMINPGSSGGGAFNDDGQLIGVNTMSIGGSFGWNGISMAVDSRTIREFLK